jgi:hypothetical protein
MARTQIKERDYLPFNATELADKINRFNAFREGNTISTQIDGRKLDVEVSNQYRFFDFKSFANNVIGLIADQTTIYQYSLHIRKCVQEIDLLTNPIIVGNDVYYQHLSLLNSNDRSRALQFNAGILRWSENGTGTKHAFIVPVPNASTSERAIHKGKTFEEKVDNINAFVDTLPTLMDKQMKIIDALGHKNVSVKSIVRTILAERKPGTTEYTISAINRAKAFLHRVSQNMSFTEIVDAGLDIFHLDLLKKPIDFSRTSHLDITINLYDAFLWYTEIFKNRDTSVINRESNRFFELSDTFVTTQFAKEDERELV